MLKRFCSALCLCLLAAPLWAQTAADATAVEPNHATPGTESAEPPAPEPEKILIVGQRPGPGLWKISKGEHVLWVFGTYAPLPKKMEWRSQQVESIIARSQEYLSPPSANTKVGFFGTLSILPFVIGLNKNPDGARLQELLPADVYARWLVLKAKYIGDDDGIERDRPIAAADTLFRKALDQAGLSSGRDVRTAIEKIVKKNAIKMTPTNVDLVMHDPVAMVRDFKRNRLDDTDCFAKTLQRLETDLDFMRTRANAWATGDLEVIRKLSFADREGACRAAMANAEFLKGRAAFEAIEQRLQDAWVNTADAALARNASTFAVLNLSTILDAHGYVAALQARGYTVENPN